MQSPDGQLMPAMPMMPGMKKHTVVNQQSKTKENKKDARLNDNEGKKETSKNQDEPKNENENAKQEKEQAKKEDIKNWD